MNLELPNDILRRAEVNTADVLVAVAIQFYADNRIDYDDALRLSGLSPASFNRELVTQGLVVQQYLRRGTRSPHQAAG